MKVAAKSGLADSQALPPLPWHVCYASQYKQKVYRSAYSSTCTRALRTLVTGTGLAEFRQEFITRQMMSILASSPTSLGMCTLLFTLIHTRLSVRWHPRSHDALRTLKALSSRNPVASSNNFNSKKRVHCTTAAPRCSGVANTVSVRGVPVPHHCVRLRTAKQRL